MKSLRSLLVMSVLAVSALTMLPGISHAGDMMDKGMGMAMEETKAEVAINGFCPVCVIHGMSMKGRNNFVTEYNGKVYKFMDIKTQKEFINDPETYTKDLEAKYQALMKK